MVEQILYKNECVYVVSISYRVFQALIQQFPTGLLSTCKLANIAKYFLQTFYKMTMLLALSSVSLTWHIFSKTVSQKRKWSHSWPEEKPSSYNRVLSSCTPSSLQHSSVCNERYTGKQRSELASAVTLGSLTRPHKKIYVSVDATVATKQALQLLWKTMINSIHHLFQKSLTRNMIYMHLDFWNLAGRV